MASQKPEVGVFDPGVWSVVVLAGLVAVVLRFTVFGRYCYAIGSNEATARLCGMGVDRTKVWIYTLAGLFAGWAGILLFAHGSSGDPHAGKQLELEVIAAVVIGGASLTGGQGNVSGTLLGVLILGILENGVSVPRRAHRNQIHPDRDHCHRQHGTEPLAAPQDVTRA